MKRIFLISLLSAITFCASSQVNLTDDQARWFLEQNEKVKIYEQNSKTKDQRISLLENKIFQQQIIIHSYESDSITFRTIISTDRGMMAFKDKQLAIANKEIKRQKRQKVFTVIIAGTIIGLLIGN